MTKKEKRQKKIKKKKKKIRRQERGRGACKSGVAPGALEQTALAFFILKKRKC